MIEGLRRGRPAFLASVTSADEADVALRSGADVIDCKNPAAGALGALDAAVVREVVARVDGRVPVSATIGDLPADADAMVAAAIAMAGTGVDIVKVGFFGDGAPEAAIAAFGKAALGKARLVAVMMADCGADLALIPELAAAGFAGVMLDTADKSAGSLTAIFAPRALSGFLDSARAYGLFAGLAGSLREQDIAGLSRLVPDVLGFRGALCNGGRSGVLDPERVASVRRALDRAPADAAEASVA